MAAQRDYYQLLGVAETASTDEIKKAFRRLAKQYHPDRNPNNPQASERFKEINEAHDVLSDPEKRKKYDTLRRYGAFAGAGSAGPRGRRETTGRGAPDSGDFDMSDFGGSATSSLRFLVVVAPVARPSRKKSRPALRFRSAWRRSAGQ